MTTLQGAKLLVISPTSALRKTIPGTVLAWLGMLSLWILGKLLLALFFPILNVPMVAAEFAWKNIAILGLLGLLGAYLSTLTGFPDALSPAISNRKRLLLPFLVGVIIAEVEIIIELLFHGTQLLTTAIGGQFNVNFPASLVVYPAGVSMIEAYYRLILLPLLLFIISNLILGKRGQVVTFWVLAAILSLMEPLAQMGAVVAALGPKLPAGWQLMVIPAAAVTYFLDLSQAYAFRRWGLLASYMIRLGEYLTWHILFWNFLSPLLH